MKNTIYFILLIRATLYNVAFANDEPNNIKTNTTVTKKAQSKANKNSTPLQEYCGYEFDRKIKRNIKKSTLNESKDYRTITFDLELNLKNRQVIGKTVFVCPTTIAHLPPQVVSARDQISLEDAGGRYARIVEWERPSQGDGWSGTAAYVNSIFGDGQRLDANDYFLICPNTPKNACFSIEFEVNRLTAFEAMEVLNIMSHIKLKH